MTDSGALPATTTPMSIAKPPPHPLDAEWFMHVDGTNYGPFTGHQFREFVQDGRLNRDSEVNRAGTETWVKAGEDKALALLFPSSVSPRNPQSGSNADASSGHVTAAPGATIVQVTNNLAPERPNAAIFLDAGEAKAKSAGVALLLSLLICGAGQMYNGQVGKGLLMLFGCILLWFVLLGWIINIWSWIDAYQTAKAMNDRYLRRIAAGAIL